MTSPLGGIAPVGVGALGSTTAVTNAGIPALKPGEGGDGFAAIGTLPKGAWVAILAVCIVLTLLLGSTGIFGLIGVAAALVYLLDVRAGLRDLSDGKGFW